MSVGSQASTATMDQNLTNFSHSLRDLCVKIKNLNTEINNQGQGLAAMQALGYSSAANPQNPGGISDSQWALNALAYLNTIAGAYFGTVQQGGTGGTGAILFNFDNALSPLWAGQ